MHVYVVLILALRSTTLQPRLLLQKGFRVLAVNPSVVKTVSPTLNKTGPSK